MGFLASEKGNRWRFFGLAVGLVILQRAVLTLTILRGLTHSHKPWTLYSLFVQGFSHWDSTWYILIAKTGYTNLKQTAFWPIYPLTMRALHWCTNLNLDVCGVLISFIAFIFALFFLGMVVEREFSSRTAVMAMLLYAFFPTAFYFDAVYTEALFMALSLGAVYYANKQRFWTAGVLALLATLTRNSGLLLVLVLGFDYIRAREMGHRFWKAQWWKQINLRFIGVLLPVVGLVGYCVWLKVRFGSFLAFLEAEHYWHRGYMPPWKSFAHTLLLVFHQRHTMMKDSYVTFEAGAFTFAVVMLLLGLRYLRTSATQVGWWLYLLAITWITSSEPALNLPDYLLSLPRFALMMFPGFAYLADFRPRWLVWLVLAGFSVLLALKGNEFFHMKWIA